MSGAASTRAVMVTALFAHLEEAGIPYCVLAGFEQLPAVASDVDFMVSNADFARLPQALSNFAARAGCRLVQAMQHESCACYYVLAWHDGPALCFLPPDAAADFRRDGRLWLSAEAVLQNRRRLVNGIFAAAPADAFAYYLIKRIGKRALGEAQGTRLAAYYREDIAGASQQLARLLPRSAQAVQAILAAGDWRALAGELPVLARELAAQPPAEGGAGRIAAYARDLWRRLRRWVEPSGLCVAFLGADGSGKSSVIDAVARQMEPAFRRVERFHLRPRLIAAGGAHSEAVTAPHSQPPRGMLASALKLMLFWADYLAGYILRLRPALVRSTLVLFDRYFCDVLADPKRLRYGGPRWLARLSNALIPQPDLLIVLDAPADVLYARKQEISPAELARLREAYLSLASTARQATVIDAAQPLPGVIADAEAAMLAVLEQRTRQRLKLERTH